MEPQCGQSIPDMWPKFGHVGAEVHTVVGKRQLSVLKTLDETWPLRGIFWFLSHGRLIT